MTPTIPTIYKQYRLRSWDEFLKIIAGAPYSNWAFRGHRKEAWPLASTLSRYFRNFHIDPRAWPQQEGRILRVFKRKAHQFLTPLPDPDDDFQWLALMQHHGAPTRLLDFTWSPYVAAFFALEHATGDAAVWALNPADISPVRVRRSPKSQQPTITTRGMDPRRKGNFARYFLKGNREIIWLGEPDTMNRRLIAQSGTFALAGVLDKPMEEVVRKYRDPKNMMAKFILPAAKVRETGLRELYRMQITNATLFPDLDGLARSLAYELEIHWAYNPRTMESFRTED
jgi:hypothetical protein